VESLPIPQPADVLRLQRCSLIMQKGMGKMINVLIVDDDPMVAEINRRYLNSLPDFACAKTTLNASDALSALKECPVDLVLLDIYMPTTNGLQLLQEIRQEAQCVDVIIISAASDMEHVQFALRLGVVDYLIKPFEFDRFSTALQDYAEMRHKLACKQRFNQADLDGVLFTHKETVNRELPKGLTRLTLQLIVDAILHLTNESFSTNYLACQVGISRVSMRKYLSFLEDIGFLRSHLDYRPIGRPIYQYRIDPANLNTIENYLK